MGLFSTPRKSINASADDTSTASGSKVRKGIRAVFTSRQSSVTYGRRNSSVGLAATKKSKPLTITIDPQIPSRGVACRFVATSTKLGSGAYGAVLLGNDLITREPVAIKFIPDGRMRNTSLEREVTLLQRLSDIKHPALVKFHGHVRPADVKAGEIRADGSLPLPKPHTTCHALVMEAVRGGELFDYVVKMEGLGEPESAPLFGQLCDAVHAAHGLGIAHRDLKLENVLLVRKKNAPAPSAGTGQREQQHQSAIKLIDWGLAHQHVLGPNGQIVQEMLHSRCGSRSYMAPEVTNRDISSTVGYDGFAADVWSLGVCLFAMHLAFFPFEQANPEHDWRARRVIEAQRAGKSTMATILSFYPQKAVNGGLSDSLLSLLDRMLVFNPRKRAPLAEVLCSEWLAPHVPSRAFAMPRSLALANMPSRGGHTRSVSTSSSISDGAITPRSTDVEPPLYASGTRAGCQSSRISIERIDSKGSTYSASTTCTMSSVASSRGSLTSAFPSHVAASVAQAVARMTPPPPSPTPSVVVAGASAHRGQQILVIPEQKHGRHSSGDVDKDATGALEIAAMLSKACKLSDLSSPRKPDRAMDSSAATRSLFL